MMEPSTQLSIDSAVDGVHDIDSQEATTTDAGVHSGEEDSEVEFPSAQPAAPASSVGSSSGSSRSASPSPSPPSRSRASTPAPAEQSVRGNKQRPSQKFNRNHALPPPQNEPLDLTDLYEPSFVKERDHPPPPELFYDSYEDAIKAVDNWGLLHGTKFIQRKWAKGGKTRRLMCCYRHGEVDDRRDRRGVKRKRQGASSQRTGCPMQFWIVIKEMDQEGYFYRCVEFMKKFGRSSDLPSPPGRIPDRPAEKNFSQSEA